MEGCKTTIDPYNSKTRAQVIQSRTHWHSVLKQKKKSESNDSLIKHLLDVAQKQEGPATGGVAQSKRRRMKKKKKIKKLNQLNSIFNNFFFISPLLHEYSFFDPRWGPWTSGPANIAKAAARIAVGKDRKDLGGKIFSKKKKKI